MTSLLSLSGLAVVLYASTNIDGLFVLLTFFMDRKYRKSHVVLGQYLAMAILFAVSVLAASASKVFPVDRVAWLGLLPVAIGCKRILDWRFGSRPDSEETGPRPRSGAGGAVMTVLAVNLSNGGDNISVYTPQFAVHSGAEIAVTGLVFAVMAGIWCAIAQGITSHPALKAPLRAYARRAVPFLLVFLGFLTLYEGGVIRIPSL